MKQQVSAAANPHYGCRQGVVVHKKRESVRKAVKITMIIMTMITCRIHGQELHHDSTKVAKTVYDFYNWYINSNRHDLNKENRPVFVIDTSDSVSLDLTKYLKNLRKFRFSNTLISREKLAYKNCEDNLKTIAKKEFLSFDDIDDYENIGCDFNNSYKWIGGQELCDGIIIVKQDFIDKTHCRIEIEYYSINGESKSYWNNKTIVLLEKMRNDWEITEIEL